MRKIANTIEGNVLIEMTTGEWERLQREPDATVYSLAFDSLEEWRSSFLESLKSPNLKLSSRLRNSLCRAINIYTYVSRKIDGQWVDIKTPPHIRAWMAFARPGSSANKYVFSTLEDATEFIFIVSAGDLMGFDEWCDYALSNPTNISAIRNVGKKATAELIEAIGKYKVIQ